MDQLALFGRLNFWDIPVLEVKLIREPSGEYNAEVTLQVPKWLVPGGVADVPARLVFTNSTEFLASIDVERWSQLGPEFGDQAATVISTEPFRARYILGLRDPGSTVEIVAESFVYDGPDIFGPEGERVLPKVPRVRDILA